MDSVWSLCMLDHVWEGAQLDPSNWCYGEWSYFRVFSDSEFMLVSLQFICVLTLYYVYCSCLRPPPYLNLLWNTSYHSPLPALSTPNLHYSLLKWMLCTPSNNISHHSWRPYMHLNYQQQFNIFKSLIKAKLGPYTPLATLYACSRACWRLCRHWASFWWCLEGIPFAIGWVTTKSLSVWNLISM